MMKQKGFCGRICGLLAVILFILVSSCNQLPADSASSTGTSAPIENTGYAPSDISVLAPEDDGIDITQYRLAVYGLVDNPLNLNYESIQAYPPENQRAGLYCDNDFLSAQTWTGVPVSTLLNEAGIKPGAGSVVFHAKDSYSASLTLDDVMIGGIILAYAADGQTLSEGDGYPLRVVANGYNGSSWVRWVVGIEVK